jgi:hypothetical protein
VAKAAKNAEEARVPVRARLAPISSVRNAFVQLAKSSMAQVFHDQRAVGRKPACPALPSCGITCDEAEGLYLDESECKSCVIGTELNQSGDGCVDITCDAAEGLYLDGSECKSY